MLDTALYSASFAYIFSQVSNHFPGVGLRSETVKLGCWSILMFLIYFAKLLSSVWECKFFNYLTWDSQMKRIKIMLPIFFFFFACSNLFFFFQFVFIHWRLIVLQYCSGCCHTLTWISHGFTCVPHPNPPPASLSIPSHPSGSSQCTSPEHPSQASNLDCWSVSPLIAYFFQCCSLWTSHRHLLPQSLKVCSVHLCLFFFCFAYRVIITIFLNSIYMH